MTTAAIQPRLVVDDAATAISFYVAALGGEELVRHADPSGRVVHAEVRIGADVLSVTEADGDLNRSPAELGGSPLLLTLTVEDATAVADAMVARGAAVVIPVDDRPYGRREGRLRDPSGHLWIVGQPLSDPATPSPA